MSTKKKFHITICKKLQHRLLKLQAISIIFFLQSKKVSIYISVNGNFLWGDTCIHCKLTFVSPNKTPFLYFRLYHAFSNTFLICMYVVILSLYFNLTFSCLSLVLIFYISKRNLSFFKKFVTVTRYVSRNSRFFIIFFTVHSHTIRQLMAK